MISYRGIIGIMGSGEMARPEDIGAAYELGKRLAEAGYIVLCGGRPCGVMKAAAEGTKAGGGISLGILPGKEANEADPSVTIPIVTGIGDARNLINVLTSDVVIAIGYTPGTLSEIALAVKNNKKVLLLNQCAESLIFFKTMYNNCINSCNSIDESLDWLNSYFLKLD